MVFLFLAIAGQGQPLRWQLDKGTGIKWELNPSDKPHTDHIEMSGQKISAIVTYGVNNNNELVIKKKLVFPMLRTIPNNTHGSYQVAFDEHSMPSIFANGQVLIEKPVEILLNGILKINSNTNTTITTERAFFPSTEKAAFIEMVKLTNNGKVAVNVQIPAQNRSDTSARKDGVYGAYIVNAKTENDGNITLNPGAHYHFYTYYTARVSGEIPSYVSANYEYIKRGQFLNELSSNLILETPNDTLNRMFEFAKIRSAESIFDTHGGLMHSPGGGAYYAAIWANDQAEYMNPFFPYLGNAEGNESAINSFRHFSRFMNLENKPIPSSIIAEGLDIWNGKGDRGDQAMIAYGAALFALTYADVDESKKLWELIQWCFNYLDTKVNKEGVIASDTDELEGRFPTGEANLSTNCLAYGAMMAASKLATALKKDTAAATLIKKAAILKINIEKYFGANVQGFDTYKYYKENTTLRSWICLPLVMGIFNRKEETLKALLSDYLWTKNGILTESGDTTFWDRGTLYAFRGLFYGAATDTALSYFKYYSSQRLLGEHVPYAIEAWPEGNQRHLAAESGLYCRVITEGLFGITPLGFNKFSVSPHLPKEWNEMSLNHIKAFQSDFGIKVLRYKKQYKVILTVYKGKTQEVLWDGVDPVQFVIDE